MDFNFVHGGKKFTAKIAFLIFLFLLSSPFKLHQKNICGIKFVNNCMQINKNRIRNKKEKYKPSGFACFGALFSLFAFFLSFFLSSPFGFSLFSCFGGFTSSVGVVVTGIDFSGTETCLTKKKQKTK